MKTKVNKAKPHTMLDLCKKSLKTIKFLVPDSCTSRKRTLKDAKADPQAPIDLHCSKSAKKANCKHCSQNGKRHESRVSRTACNVNCAFTVLHPLIWKWNEMKCRYFRPLCFWNYEGWIGPGTAWALFTSLALRVHSFHLVKLYYKNIWRKTDNPAQYKTVTEHGFW